MADTVPGVSQSDCVASWNPPPIKSDLVPRNFPSPLHSNGCISFDLLWALAKKSFWIWCRVLAFNIIQFEHSVSSSEVSDGIFRTWAWVTITAEVNCVCSIWHITRHFVLKPVGILHKLFILLERVALTIWSFMTRYNHLTNVIAICCGSYIVSVEETPQVTLNLWAKRVGMQLPRKLRHALESSGENGEFSNRDNVTRQAGTLQPWVPDALWCMSVILITLYIYHYSSTLMTDLPGLGVKTGSDG